MERQYTDPCSTFELSNLMTAEEFNKYVEEGCIMDYDGLGYWVKMIGTEYMESKDQVFDTPQLDATHVTWFNR